MITGKVQRINYEKGFMFVRDPETGLEYFAHKSAVQGGRFGDLQQMQLVQFEPGEGPKGPRTEIVRTL